MAPAILPAVDEPYVAIEDAVVLYLDLDRKDYKSQKTSHLNPKLAKLMGITSPSVGPEDCDDEYTEDEDEDEESLLEEDEDEEAYKTDSEEREVKEEEDYNEQERQLLANDLGNDGIDNVVALKSSEDVYPSQENQQQRSSKKLLKPSNLGEFARYRSKAQLNKAAKREFNMGLNAQSLPECIESGDDINNEWTIKECFEVTKWVLSKHEGLFDHIKLFHINHLQQEIKKQQIELMEMDQDETIIDSSKEEEKEKEKDDKLTDLDNKPSAIKTAKTYEPQSIALHKNRSLFARPSSMKMKKKLSMPGMIGRSQTDKNN
eukprot:531456_1